jgi:ABC-type multidrug transport system permease subunit
MAADSNNASHLYLATASSKQLPLLILGIPLWHFLIYILLCQAAMSVLVSILIVSCNH